MFSNVLYFFIGISLSDFEYLLTTKVKAYDFLLVHHFAKDIFNLINGGSEPYDVAKFRKVTCSNGTLNFRLLFDDVVN